MNSGTKRDATANGKKPYRRPRLTVYGNLRALTKMVGAKGGAMNDGGGRPKTRT